jgi:flavodoxin
MRTLVVYDSQFGNTQRVTQTIAETLQITDMMHVKQAAPQQLSGLELLIVGSPTQRLNMTPAIANFLKAIPKGALDGVRVAAFDTRFTVEKIESIRMLPFFVRLFGYAAEKIARQLEAKGGIPAGDPGLFYVLDTEGPLLEGELKRAQKWANSLI